LTQVLIFQLIESVTTQSADFTAWINMELTCFKESARAEYAALTNQFNMFQKQSLASKKAQQNQHNMIVDGILKMFDEYKIISEWVFHEEISKLQDEILNITERSEHEIMYLGTLRAYP